MRNKKVVKKLEKKNDRAVWQNCLKDWATRRTIEKLIASKWKCENSIATEEFDRALNNDEFMQKKIGLLNTVTAYKLR